MRHTSRLRWIAVVAASLLPLPAMADDLADKCQSDAMIVLDASGSMGATDYAIKLPRIACTALVPRRNCAWARR